MKIEQILHQLEQVEDLAALDELLATRERLRTVYAFLGDAAGVTGNNIFLMYASMVAGSGKLLNKEIDILVHRMAQRHSDYEPSGPRPDDDGGDRT